MTVLGIMQGTAGLQGDALLMARPRAGGMSMGCLVSRGENRWLLKWDRHVLVDGRRVRKQCYKTIRGTKEEAKMALDAALLTTPVKPKREPRYKRAGWTREKRLAALIEERGLSTRGFTKALRSLIHEFATDDECCGECGDSINGKCSQECLARYQKDIFGEWFPFDRKSVVPTAYKIIRDEPAESIHDITIQVYEVENTAEMPDWKLALYGDAADRDSARFELHILDKYDHEIVIPHDELMQFMFIGVGYLPPTDELREHWAELKKHYRARAAAQHHAPVVVDHEAVTGLQRELRAIQAKLKDANSADVTGLFQDVIYGLGSGATQAEMAARFGIEPSVVRSVARILSAKQIEPRHIVKDTHARWKAAYDAVRELGIEP